MVCIVYSSVYGQVAIGEKPEQGFRPGSDAPLAQVSLDKPSLSLSLFLSPSLYFNLPLKRNIQRLVIIIIQLNFVILFLKMKNILIFT